MTKLYLVAALLLCSASAYAQSAQVNCQKPLRVTREDITAAGLTQLIPAPAAGNIVVCGYSVQVAETTANATFGISTGTGTNCAANTAAFRLGFGDAGTKPSIGYAYANNSAPLMPQQNAVCLRIDSAVAKAVVSVDYVISLGY